MKLNSVSIQPGMSVTLPLVLMTGTNNEIRVQADNPGADILYSRRGVVSAEVVSGPAIKITALEAGETDVSIKSGGLTTIGVFVEETNSSLRWVPTGEISVDEPAPGPTPLPINGVDGPTQSSHGDPFYIQRDADNSWHVWWDVDTAPGPDTKRPLPVVIGDENLTPEYRGDIASRATLLGYT